MVSQARPTLSSQVTGRIILLVAVTVLVGGVASAERGNGGSASVRPDAENLTAVRPGTETFATARPTPAMQRPGQRGAGAFGSGRNAVSRSFETVAPAIGEPMPDLSVHDRDGNELRLRELLGGHYTVLILGCLT